MTAAAAKAVIRPVCAALMDLDDQRCGIVTVVCDDRLPELIMRDGVPFLFHGQIDGGAIYRQVRPFRCIGS